MQQHFTVSVFSYLPSSDSLRFSFCLSMTPWFVKLTISDFNYYSIYVRVFNVQIQNENMQFQSKFCAFAKVLNRLKRLSAWRIFIFYFMKPSYKFLTVANVSTAFTTNEIYEEHILGIKLQVQKIFSFDCFSWDISNIFLNDSFSP